MQEHDVINVQTEPMRSAISRLLSRILKRKQGYCVEFEINKLEVVNDEERILIQFDLGMEATIEVINAIIKEFGSNGKKWMKNLLEILNPAGIDADILKFLYNVWPKKTIYHLIEDGIERKWKKVKAHINYLDCSKGDGKFQFLLNADIKIKREDIEYVLESAGLI